MAKAGFWLRGAKGKLAGATVGKGSQGGTVIREITTPKNPQTEAQMIQRIIWNSIVKAYSFTKEITDHSFEGIQAGSKTQQVFTAENVGTLRERVAKAVAAGQNLYNILDFSPIGSQYVPANAILLSKGSLPSVIVAVNEEDSNVMEIAATDNTYAGVASALGLQRGDQLTFITVSVDTAGNKRFNYARVILDPMEDGAQADFNVPFIADGAINLPSPRNTGELTSISFADSKVLFNVSPIATATVAGTVIVSRFNGTSWLRSTSHLVFNTEGEYTLGACLDMVKEGISTLSNRYLNNSGTGNVATFNSGGGVPVAGIGSVSVNGIAISATGATTVAKGTSNSITINARNADGLYAAYRKGNGAWITAAMTNSAKTWIGVTLADGDSLSFAIGEMTGSVFSATRVWGGTATIDEINPAITGVTIGGVSIPNSGVTEVRSGSNKAVVVTTDDSNGMYASYRKGTGAWAAPVVIASNNASLNIATLADDEEITVAIGTGSTAAAFQASITWGGKAKGYTPEVTGASLSSFQSNNNLNLLTGTYWTTPGSQNPQAPFSYTVENFEDSQNVAIMLTLGSETQHSVGDTITASGTGYEQLNRTHALTAATGSFTPIIMEGRYYLVSRESADAVTGVVLQALCTIYGED